MATTHADIAGLRDRVTVQSKTQVTDAQLGRSTSWGTFATIWADVRYAGSSETRENDRVTTVTNYEVEARYRTDITSVMRLSWTPFRGSAKTLRIVGGPRVKPGRPERMLIDCQEAA